MSHLLTRREVLQRLAAAGLIALAPGAASGATAAALDSVQPLTTRLRGLFTNTKSANAVGLRYLAAAPGEADARLLTGLICGTRDRYRRLMEADSGRLRELLIEQQKQDFGNGRVVTLEGWILSETEVRLCAIAAITPE